MRTNLIEGLKSRLGFTESKPLYVHAAILTPRYGVKWLTPSERRILDKDSIIQAIENDCLILWMFMNFWSSHLARLVQDDEQDDQLNKNILFNKSKINYKKTAILKAK